MRHRGIAISSFIIIIVGLTACPPTSDLIPPDITILGDNPVTIEVGSNYVDAGATAWDNVDGAVGVNVLTNLDSNTPGTYFYQYSAVDRSLNVSTRTRTIYVVPRTEPADTTKPDITILGDNPAIVLFGSAYVEAGATAWDKVDGDLTKQIVITGLVDTQTLGVYTITYRVNDSSGNVASETRTVKVEAIKVAGFKQPIHQFNFPVNGGDMQYYSSIGTNAGIIAGGPSADIFVEKGVLRTITRTIGGAWSYGGFWVSAKDLLANHQVMIDPTNIMPWPINSSYQAKINAWYIKVKGTGDWRVELKKGPAGAETLVDSWSFVNFQQLEYVEIARQMTSNKSPFKVLNFVAETNSNLFVDEIGFYVELPVMSDLRYAFLASAAQVFRCCDDDYATGMVFVRDRSNWPIGDFDSVPGLGFASLVAACGSRLGVVLPDDARVVARACVATLLAIPAHPSGFLPHWTKITNGTIARHPNSEISTVDTALAYLSAYKACVMLGLSFESSQLRAKIKSLDFGAVTISGEISHGFDPAGQLLPYTWREWGGETLLVLILAKMNDLSKNYSYQTIPRPAPNSPVVGGTGFIAELAGLFFAKFGGENVGPDAYGVDWYAMRQLVLAEQLGATLAPSFLGGYSAGEIVSVDGFTRYHVGGTDPLHTGEVGYDSPWVFPHYLAMVAPLNVLATTSRVVTLRQFGLLSPLGGQAEAILWSPSDWTIKRWNSLQGVLNGFFSALGYYHAIVLSGNLINQVYRVDQNDVLMKEAIDSLFAGPLVTQESFVLQAENGQGNGSIMPRSNAIGKNTVLLFPSQSRLMEFSTVQVAKFTLTVRYSNDNFGSLEIVDVFVDGTMVGSFESRRTVGPSPGAGWNVFVTDSAGMVELVNGNHTVTVSIRPNIGDGYGIEIDQIAFDLVN